MKPETLTEVELSYLRSLVAFTFSALWADKNAAWLTVRSDLYTKLGRIRAEQKNRIVN